MPATPQLIRDLEGQVSPSHVLTRTADRAAYAFDSFGASGDRHLPDVVVFPASTDEVSDVVGVCAHHRAAIVPRGAGTGYSGGAVPLRGGVVLNLCRMTRLDGPEPEAMRLAAQAGAITASLHRRAAAQRLLYPPDPGSASTCTIGGNVACNASGSHAHRYGATADYLVGATVVLADGRVLRLGESGSDGPARLLRLLPGSEGTLAVVTEVLLRLVHAPATRATLAAVYQGMEGAAAASAALVAAGIVPAALEVLDGAALAAVAATGADPVAPGAGALVLVELDGDAIEVASQVEAVTAALDVAGAERLITATDEAESRRLWAARKAISAAVAAIRVGKVNEDVCVPRDRVAELVAIARGAGERRELPVVTFGHLGDGIIHCTFLIDPRREGERRRGDAAAAEVYEAVVAMGGSLTGEHGAGYVKLPHLTAQLGDGTAALMRRLKAALDPQGLLNPGKKVPPADGISAGAASAPPRGEAVAI